MQNDKVPRWFHEFTERFSDHVRDNEKAHGELSKNIEKVRGDLSKNIEKVRGDLTFRVVVIVGSFAGLSTALVLGVLPLLIDSAGFYAGDRR